MVNSIPRAARLPLCAHGPRLRKWLWRALIGALLLGIAFAFSAKPLFGLEFVRSNAKPTTAYDSNGYARLLGECVFPDGVDYTCVRLQRALLDEYVATLGALGPKSAPMQFPTREDQLAYYLNAYNALVLFGVLHYSPSASVTEISGRIVLKPGAGFFVLTHFRLDGVWVSLFELENAIIRRKFNDPRIHSAINCASRSCPRLQSIPFDARDLEAQLAQASADFVSAPRTVEVDHVLRVVRLSRIFDWYEADFSPGVAEWISTFASEQLRNDIFTAQTNGYAREFFEYDWELNRCVQCKHESL